MWYALLQMTRRNVKLYLNDKANVFFSLLSPLIILGLYILFIGRLQIDGLTGGLAEMGITGVGLEVRAFCDSWMLSGVMACACITVALCASGTVVQDKRRGIVADAMASPIPKWLPTAAYFLSVAFVALMICLIVLGVCFLYLAASGTWYLTFGEVFGCIGVTLLSVLSSTMIVVLMASIIKTEGAFSGLNIIMGTMIGFLIGAYMPISTFPKALQYITLFIPGSYSAGLFRHYFMGGALDELAKVVPAEFAAQLGKDYSLTFDFFGMEIAGPTMAWILAATVLLFATINVLYIFLHARKKNGMPPR